MHRIVNGIQVEMTDEEVKLHLEDQAQIESKRALKKDLREKKYSQRMELLNRLATILQCSPQDLDLLFSNERSLKCRQP